jgi:ankyrin repeat protein
MLAELRMIKGVGADISGMTGHIGATYLSQVMLSKRAVSTTLENYRQMARRFAADHEDPDGTYPQYIEALSSYIASSCSASKISHLCSHDPDSAENVSSLPEYEYLAAAAYMGKISVARELCADKKNLGFSYPTMEQPHIAACKGGHVAIVDLLLEQTERHGENMTSMWRSLLRAASRAGSVETVEYLLANADKSRRDYGFSALGHSRDHSRFESYLESLETPNVEVFDLMIRYKDKTLAEQIKRHKEKFAGMDPKKDWVLPLMEKQLPPLTAEELSPLLHTAAENRWESMVSRLLDIGAPPDGVKRWTVTPLMGACGARGDPGPDEVVRLLLQHGARITGGEVSEAAIRGRKETVRILLEHGADSNHGTVTPIVSAVKLEHKEMFHLLLKHGAELGDAGPEAVKVAREEGLESMLALLEEHSVDVA